MRDLKEIFLAGFPSRFVVRFFDLTVDLLGLLKWKSDRSNLQANLESLMKVDGEEVVKV